MIKLVEFKMAYRPSPYFLDLEYTPSAYTSKENFEELFKKELETDEKFVRASMYRLERIGFGRYKRVYAWHWSRYGVFPHTEVAVFFGMKKNLYKVKMGRTGFWVGGPL